MRSKRVALRHLGMQEIVGRFVAHADLLHDPLAGYVDDAGNPHDLRQSKLGPGEVEHRGRAFGSETAAPESTGDLPGNLNGWMGRNSRADGSVECHETEAAYERAVGFVFH